MTTQSTITRNYWKRGEPLVWLAGATMTIILLMVGAILLIVLANGMGYFWPHRVALATLRDGTRALGEITDHDRSPLDHRRRMQFKIGNRDLNGLDFKWFDADQVRQIDWPTEAVVLERRENGNFYGFLSSLKVDGLPAGNAATSDLFARMQAARAALEGPEDNIGRVHAKMSALSAKKESVRLAIQKLRYEGQPENAPAIVQLAARGRFLDEQFEQLNQQSSADLAALRAHQAIFRDASGREKAVALIDIMRAYRPNQMSLGSKIHFYGSKVWELLSTPPREANTEGGLLPAIFGTVLLVFLMSLFCIPLGVIASVYLHEYAREGLLVRLVRIAVNNLAGVPSIVYGVFGLGFFVYGLGGAIDRLFFPERLPAPTFGTGGLLWSSLTLALLTVPVVIVATEEALAAVPRGIREGSLALGATKFQTLVRILLPMASPGIMTGLILAMARAAGEVAPLMLVGVVKLAPAMPLDSQFPYMHLDRKFMHLGFHIFDVGFQSPNVEAAKPMVFVTTLLLLAIVIVMSAAAIHLRNRMRRRYRTGAF